MEYISLSPCFACLSVFVYMYYGKRIPPSVFFQGEQRQLPLLGAMGWLASLKGHALDLEVAIGRQVVDGLQVEAVGEFEFVSTRLLDG